MLVISIAQMSELKKLKYFAHSPNIHLKAMMRRISVVCIHFLDKPHYNHKFDSSDLSPL